MFVLSGGTYAPGRPCAMRNFWPSACELDEGSVFDNLELIEPKQNIDVLILGQFISRNAPGFQ
jgi:hypothetical protein